jgi:hypothetical protein
VIKSHLFSKGAVPVFGVLERSSSVQIHVKPPIRCFLSSLAVDKLISLRHRNDISRWLRRQDAPELLSLRFRDEPMIMAEHRAWVIVAGEQAQLVDVAIMSQPI